jgi:hypothetical protein
MENRLPPGTEVVTVEIENPSSDWSENALASRRFGIPGMVIGHHDSHGLCYAIAHFRSGMQGGDSFISYYDPEELKVTKRPVAWIED